MTKVVLILASGVVLWWFVNPKNNGVNFLAELFGSAINAFRYFLGKPVQLSNVITSATNQAAGTSTIAGRG
jgi:hypothetical protein